MNKEKTNILIVGLLATGSSAMVDLLREYDEIHIVQNEFNDFRAPGLVADQLDNQQDNEFKNEIGRITSLKSRLRLIYGIFPILKWEIKTILEVKHRFKYNLIRIKQLNLLKRLNTILVSTISVEEKFHQANHWIQEVGRINNPSKEFVLFDQPLLSTINTGIWERVFNPFKLIVVYRDPKDQLAEIIKKGILYAPYGAPNVTYSGVALESIFGRNRESAITIHINAIKKRFEWIDNLKNELNRDSLLLVDFEGLVNNYNEYKIAIESFIGIKNQNKSKYKLYFDPENAKESIGIYNKFLKKDEIHFLSDADKWYFNTIKETQIINYSSFSES